MYADKYDVRNSDTYDRHFRLCLSRGLSDSSYGNVEFLFENKSEENTRKLFAFSHIWEHPKFSECGIVP